MSHPNHLPMYDDYMHDLEDCIAPPDTDCSICMEPCDSIHYAVVSIDHGAADCYFHRRCIESWFNNDNTTCPNDRGRLWRPNQISDAQAIGMADPADLPLPLLSCTTFDIYLDRIRDLTNEIWQALRSSRYSIEVVDDWRHFSDQRRELRDYVIELHHIFTPLRLGIFQSQATNTLRSIRRLLRRWRRHVERHAPLYIARVWPRVRPMLIVLNNRPQADRQVVSRLRNDYYRTRSCLDANPDDPSMVHEVWIITQQTMTALRAAGFSSSDQVNAAVRAVEDSGAGSDFLPDNVEDIEDEDEDVEMTDVSDDEEDDEDENEDEDDDEYGSEWETDEEWDLRSDDERTDTSEES